MNSIRFQSRSARSFLLPVLVLMLGVLYSAPAVAQEDAVLAGKVTDAEGNPVPNAVIVVRSLERGGEREIRADENGDYFARGFRPERYQLEVRASGYRPVQQEVRLSLGMNTVDMNLPETAVASDVDYEALNQLYDTGFKAYDAQRWEEAEEAISTLVENLEPLEGEEALKMKKSAYEILGVAHLQQGELEESVDALETLLELDPDSVSGHVWIGQAFAQQQAFEESADHLSRAAGLAPENPEIQYNAGAVLIQVDRIEEGIAAMEKAIELRPEFPVARKNLGYAYLRTEEYEKAIAMLESYLEQVPDAEDRAEVEQMIQALEAQIEQQQ